MFKMFFDRTEADSLKITDISISDLIGEKNNEYYMEAFEKIESGEKRVFNKSAVFAGPYWYIYRKMVFRGVLMIAFQAIIATMAYATKSPIWITAFLLSFLTFVYSGFYGNKDYYNRIVTLVDESKSIDNKFKGRFYVDKSGVDAYITGCWIVGTVFLYAVIIFL